MWHPSAKKTLARVFHGFFCNKLGGKSLLFFRLGFSTRFEKLRQHLRISSSRYQQIRDKRIFFKKMPNTTRSVLKRVSTPYIVWAMHMSDGQAAMSGIGE